MKKNLELIYIIEKCIREYDIKKLMKHVDLLVEELLNVLPLINEKYINNINSLFYNANVALTNKDYVLYEDILEYELKPILEKMIKE